MRKLFGNTVVVTWPDGDTSNWRLRQRGLARLRRRKQSLDRRPGLERELSLIDRQIGHLGDAVKRGRATDELLAILEAESDRKKAMARELAALDEGARLASLDGARLTRLLRAGAAENGRRGYRFKGQGTYGRLLVGEAVTSALNRPGSPPRRRRAPHRADYIVRSFR